ncbi:hypothetical protein RP20_CCG003066 [Aedes albopictus]|nr:hypothetical protein RP20_CCG003066 [Aedes albopictus]
MIQALTNVMRNLIKPYCRLMEDGPKDRRCQALRRAHGFAEEDQELTDLPTSIVLAVHPEDGHQFRDELHLLDGANPKRKTEQVCVACHREWEVHVPCASDGYAWWPNGAASASERMLRRSANGSDVDDARPIPPMQYIRAPVNSMGRMMLPAMRGPLLRRSPNRKLLPRRMAKNLKEVGPTGPPANGKAAGYPEPVLENDRQS